MIVKDSVLFFIIMTLLFPDTIHFKRTTKKKNTQISGHVKQYTWILNKEEL